MNQTPKTVAERLLEIRSLKQISQSELAIQSGVSQGTIGNIESGTRQGSGSLHKIAKALNVRLEWLRDGQLPIDPSESADDLANIARTESAGVDATKSLPPITTCWLSAMGWVERDLLLHRATDQAMTGFIEPGDLLLIHTRNTTPPDTDPRRSVFLYQYGRAVLLRHKGQNHRGETTLTAFHLDKGLYPDITINEKDSEAIQVVGRVVWRGGSA